MASEDFLLLQWFKKVDWSP
ncbi:hypothetical protein CCACVL1_00477 [Corchorus capsularis]|uniref:Uncharacterized protein n=1 Tax=Corchorus capsularis TaxID=210143 RepID=A0A1R3KWU0_COCAP|nr:hypothetical protein CCACVL1_00477 [Corchorus capsularis]